MRELVAQYLNSQLSRRGFIRGMAATGLSAAAIESMLAELGQTETVPGEDTASYRTVTGTGGELMVEQLKAAGVKYLFTNPGSTERGFFDAISDTPEIQPIMGLHEGIVVSMADGYHQATGKTALVNVHAVVGTAQMAGQMANAHHDNASMVVTAGLVDNQQFLDDRVLAPSAGFAQIDINKQFTKLSWEIRNPKVIPIALRRAFKVAATPPGGPVYIAFSTAAQEAKNVTAEVIDQDKFAVPMRVRPNQQSVEQAARWLLESERPFVLVGNQLRRANAVSLAIELIDLLALPVYAETRDWRLGTDFPNQHPLYYNRRIFRFLEGPRPDANIDLIVGLGVENFGVGVGPLNMEIPVRGESRNPALVSSTARKIAMGIDSGSMSRTEPVDLPIIADVGLALDDLLAAIRSLATKRRLVKIRASRYDRIATQIAAARRRAEQEVRGHFGMDPMHPDEIGMLTEQALDDDAVTVHENLSHDHNPNYGALQRYGVDGKMRISNVGASLGWGVGAAVGAKLGQPERQVVLRIGDGSTMYSVAGFWTMARYEIPVLTIIWNNLNYQTVRGSFAGYQGKMANSGHYTATYLGDPEIDFVQIAEGQGVLGERALTSDDFTNALKRGIAATREGKPYVIDVRVRRIGPGAESTWHRKFSLAASRTRPT